MTSYVVLISQALYLASVIMHDMKSPSACSYLAIVLPNLLLHPLSIPREIIFLLTFRMPLSISRRELASDFRALVLTGGTRGGAFSKPCKYLSGQCPDGRVWIPRRTEAPRPAARARRCIKRTWRVTESAPNRNILGPSPSKEKRKALFRGAKDFMARSLSLSKSVREVALMEPVRISLISSKGCIGG